MDSCPQKNIKSKDVTGEENVSKAPIQLSDPVTRAAVVSSFSYAFLRSFLHDKRMYIFIYIREYFCV